MIAVSNANATVPAISPTKYNPWRETIRSLVTLLDDSIMDPMTSKTTGIATGILFPFMINNSKIKNTIYGIVKKRKCLLKQDLTLY